MRARVGLVVGGLVAALILVELGLRLAVAVGWPARLADPGAYSDPLCHDSYWTMALASGRLRAHTVHEVDERLGWVPDRRNLAPIGAWHTPQHPVGDERPVLALFGDSFVFGTAEPRLADALQDLLPERRVLSFGVAGYGLDQIVLRLEDRAAALRGGEVWIGVLTSDLDRTVLRHRSGPKPSWTGAGFAWEEPVRLGTLSGGWVRMHGPWRDLDCAREEKERTAAELFEHAAAICSEHDLDCRVLLFQSAGEEQGWRQEAVVAGAEALGGLLDSRSVLEPHLYGDDRHPSGAGNRALALWLAEEAR